MYIYTLILTEYTYSHADIHTCIQTQICMIPAYIHRLIHPFTHLQYVYLLNRALAANEWVVSVCTCAQNSLLCHLSNASMNESCLIRVSHVYSLLCHLCCVSCQTHLSITNSFLSHVYSLLCHLSCVICQTHLSITNSFLSHLSLSCVICQTLQEHVKLTVCFRLFNLMFQLDVSHPKIGSSRLNPNFFFQTPLSRFNPDFSTNLELSRLDSKFFKFFEFSRLNSIFFSKFGFRQPAEPKFFSDGTFLHQNQIRAIFWPFWSSAGWNQIFLSMLQSEKWTKKCFLGENSVWTLADCEWRAAAAGLKLLPSPALPDPHPTHTHGKAWLGSLRGG